MAIELTQIAARLAALAATRDDPSAIGVELESIRAQLRQLAADNAELGVRLGVSLGLQIEH